MCIYIYTHASSKMPTIHRTESHIILHAAKNWSWLQSIELGLSYCSGIIADLERTSVSVNWILRLWEQMRLSSPKEHMDQQ